MEFVLPHIPLEIKPYITALLTSISCGLIGTYIVIRRMVFIAGGITHASFGGIGIAYFLGYHPLLGAVIAAVLSAFGIEYTTQTGKIRNDSAIALMWSLGMAIGIVFIYLSPGRPPNLMSYLFGSILVVTETELFLLLIMDVVLLFFFVFFYKAVVYTAFDRAFARAANYPVRTMEFVMAFFIAVVIVLNLRIIGIILVISLLTIPQNMANLLTSKNRLIFTWAVLFSLIGTLAGIKISEWINVPTGATVILFLMFMYLAVWLVLNVVKRFRVNALGSGES